MVNTGQNLLSELTRAQSTKDSLMQTVLMALSSTNIIIVFEGKTDYQVYDEWLKNNEIYNKAEHICAKGKSQIIELYLHAKTIKHNDILNSCKFFVDHDYDLYSYNDNCITTLNCYSVENYLVCEDSLINILKDEYQLDASRKKERDIIINQFKDDFSTFNQLAKKICLPLFLRHHIDGKAEFYNKITDVMYISYGKISLNEEMFGAIPTENNNAFVKDLERQFDSLPYVRAIRGKYHFEFIKKWLVSLRKLINEQSLLNLPKVRKDPEQMDMRRFACSITPPTELIYSQSLKNIEVLPKF